MSNLKAQFGWAAETTYGTGVTVSRFAEFNKEGLRGVYQRIESRGLRAGSRSVREDRFAVNAKGAAGSVELDVMTKGFGYWFKHGLGTCTTSGPTDSTYQHSCSIGSMQGLMSTVQLGRPFVNDASETVDPWTYKGVKVAGFQLANSIDGLLVLTLDLDAQAEDEATALASASYPTGTVEPFSFVGGSVEFADTAVDVRSCTLKVDNGLKVDRYRLNNSALKKEPVEAMFRDVTFEVELEYQNSTQVDRVTSATRAGAVGKLEFIWLAPTLIGTTTYPELHVTMAAARFDDGVPTVDGPGVLTSRLTGRAMVPTSGLQLQIDYKTADSTA